MSMVRSYLISFFLSPSCSTSSLLFSPLVFVYANIDRLAIQNLGTISPPFPHVLNQAAVTLAALPLALNSILLLSDDQILCNLQRTHSRISQNLYLGVPCFQASYL